MTGLLMWLVFFESLSISSKLTRFPHLKPVSRVLFCHLAIAACLLLLCRCQSLSNPKSKFANLKSLDHLGRLIKDLGRNGDAKRLRSLQIDGQIKLDRLFYW